MKTRIVKIFAGALIFTALLYAAMLASTNEVITRERAILENYPFVLTNGSLTELYGIKGLEPGTFEVKVEANRIATLHNFFSSGYLWVQYSVTVYDAKDGSRVGQWSTIVRMDINRVGNQWLMHYGTRPFRLVR